MIRTLFLMGKLLFKIVFIAVSAPIKSQQKVIYSNTLGYRGSDSVVQTELTEILVIAKEMIREIISERNLHRQAFLALGRSNITSGLLKECHKLQCPTE